MVKSYIGIGAFWSVILCVLLALGGRGYGAEAVEEEIEEITAEDTSTDTVAEDLDDMDIIGMEEDAEYEEIGFREDKVFLDFKEADIRDVLRVFARKANVNIVPSQRVQGTVTVKLEDVHWERALQLILEQQGMVLQKEEDGIYKVFTQDEVGAVPLVTKVYRLSYIEASDAKVILASLLTSERGTMEADTDGNKLVVSDVPAKHEEVAKVIAELDSRIRQVSIEVRVLEKTSGKETDLGIKWDVLKAYEIGASSLMDKTEIINIDQEYQALFKRTDSHQELTPNLGKLSSDQTTARYYGDIEMQEPQKHYKTVASRTAILSVDDFSLTLSALLSDANTELISNPKIATVDNRMAEIKVTRQVPIPQYSYNEQTGSYEIKSFEYKDIGIHLKVTPQINQDEYITLEVVPSVTTQFGEKTFVISGGTIAIPIIDERSAQTKVIVKSKETLVIAGLVSTDESKIIKKVPVLGDIPILGAAFRHKSTVMAKKDLLFFITPTLVETDPAELQEARADSSVPVEVVTSTPASATE